MTRNRILAALAVISLGAAPALSDDIRLTDGKVIEDVSVDKEGLIEVSYRERNQTRAVASDKVLSVRYRRKPRLVDEADTACADGDLSTAEATFDLYVEGAIANPGREKYEWAPPYAAWKVVEIRLSQGDMPGVVAAADRILKSFPESRYVPFAHMAKANALYFQDKARNAQTSLEAFRKLIDEKGLSKRWGFECDLALIQTDPSMKEQVRRDKLVVVQGNAGSQFPTVRNRARVAEGESYLNEVSSEQDVTKRMAGVEKARDIFEQILAEFSKCEPETQAGTFLGLGDCLYQEAIAKGRDVELLEKALMRYMRVVVSYKEQTRLQPKALFFAGRCYDLMAAAQDGEGAESKSRSVRLYAKVAREYPSSPWGEQAKAALR